MAVGECCLHGCDMAGRVCAECDGQVVDGSFSLLRWWLATSSAASFQCQRRRNLLFRQFLPEEGGAVVPGGRCLEHAASCGQHRGVVEWPVRNVSDRAVADVRCQVLVAVGFGSCQGIGAARGQVSMVPRTVRYRPRSRSGTTSNLCVACMSRCRRHWCRGRRRSRLVVGRVRLSVRLG